MSNVTVVGVQWGDEGKGKIVDWLSERAEIVVRGVQHVAAPRAAMARGSPQSGCPMPHGRRPDTGSRRLRWFPGWSPTAIGSR